MIEPAPLSLAGDARPDIGRFLQMRRASAPSLSPDGSSLSFQISTTGVAQVWAADEPGGWPRQLTFTAGGVTFHAWSPSSDVIVYGADRDGDEREGYYAITADGLQESVLLEPSASFRMFGGFSPDGRQIAYAETPPGSARFDIYVLNLETGQSRRVLEGRMGLYPVSWSDDGISLVLTEARGEDANDVHLLDVSSGRMRPLFTPDDPSFYGGFAWTADDDGFYVVTDDRRDVTRLGYWRRDSGVIEPVFDDGDPVESIALSADERYLAFTTNVEGWSRLRILDRENDRMIDAPALPMGVYSMDWAGEAPVLAVSVSAPALPGDVWTWDARTAETRRVTRASAAGIDLSTLIEPQHVSFEARDGEMVHGLLYLPRSSGAGAPPVVINVHGGPTAQARPRFNAVHQYLLARGIAIFDLNYRGSRGYGRRFARLENGLRRGDAVHDMADAAAYLGGLDAVDGGRVAVMGGSYGGYMAFAALTDYPDTFAAGVSMVGVSNWITGLENTSPQLRASDRLEYGDIDDPEFRAFFRELSPITRADRVRSPLLVAHGVNDPRVPVVESDQFVRAVRSGGTVVEYLRFPDEGHGIRKLRNRLTCFRRVAAFLEEHLGLSDE